MNACIRAVVRTGIYRGKQMVGIYQGYQGMIDKKAARFLKRHGALNSEPLKAVQLHIKT
jgi:6-phosphofructokinase